MSLEDKIHTVENILKDKKVAVGFSGGADSTLLAYLSSKVSEDTLLITIDNHLMPTGFAENTRKTADTFGLNHETADINFYENEDFLANTSKRCFNCRNLMYSKIEEIAYKNGYDFICDGNNITDLVQDRPGILITYQKKFKTPLIDAGLTSKEIHEYLDMNNIDYSKSTTCLATRIPTNSKTTKEKIEKIRYCEDYILDITNCKIVKLRDLDGIGIIEVDDVSEILHEERFKKINDKLNKQNFNKVCLNLSQIKDNEYIDIDYFGGSFSYHLPYSINIENTVNEITDVLISKSPEKIELEKITVYKNGLIEGHNFENSQNALDSFMKILPKIRRNI